MRGIAQKKVGWYNWNDLKPAIYTRKIRQDFSKINRAEKTIELLLLLRIIITIKVKNLMIRCVEL